MKYEPGLFIPRLGQSVEDLVGGEVRKQLWLYEADGVGGSTVCLLITFLCGSCIQTSVLNKHNVQGRILLSAASYQPYCSGLVEEVV